MQVQMLRVHQVQVYSAIGGQNEEFRITLVTVVLHQRQVHEQP